MSLLRLDKFLADAGLGTRSQVKLLLKKGLVTVNGEAAKKPEQKVDPENDLIVCEGTSLFRQEFYYYMLNKPAGYVSATEDNTAPTVLSLLKGAPGRDLFPVGRLDKDTKGLLLITNDGPLAHRLLDEVHLFNVPGNSSLGTLDVPVPEAAQQLLLRLDVFLGNDLQNHGLSCVSVHHLLHMFNFINNLSKKLLPSTDMN